MPGPPAAVAAVRTAVRDLLRQQQRAGVLRSADLLLVACSGGPDSVALASQLAFLAPRLSLRAGAVIVDHGMQPGSDTVAAGAASTCRALGLDPVLVRAADDLRAAATPKAAMAGETLARQRRYAVLDDAAQRSAAVAVLLGHTLDDQAEGVLLALGRGSGTRAVAGMAAIRGRYWRPLLGVRRSDTVGTCEALGLPVVLDPTNAVDGPWRRADGGPVPRAAVRDRALPALADALGHDPAPALARTARLAQADADLLDDLAAQALDRCTVPAAGSGGIGADDAVSLAIEALAAEPEALRTRVLHRAAVQAGAPAGDLGEAHVLALDALVTGWHGQGAVALPGRVVGTRDCGRLVLARPR